MRSFSWYLTWRGLNFSHYQDGSKFNSRRRKDCFNPRNFASDEFLSSETMGILGTGFRTVISVIFWEMLRTGWLLIQIQRYFCVVYDYAGKADLSKGYWNPER